MLFPREPFSGLGELLHTFSAVDLGHASASTIPATVVNEKSDLVTVVAAKASRTGQGEGLVWHVVNIAARFSSLTEVIAPQSYSCVNIGGKPCCRPIEYDCHPAVTRGLRFNASRQLQINLLYCQINSLSFALFAGYTRSFIP